MLERYFGFQESGTTLRTELFAGLTTFLTMSYIIFVQPMVLSGQILGPDIGTGQIGGRQVADGTLTGADLALFSIKSSNLATSVAQAIPPISANAFSVILSTGNDECPTFNGEQIYTSLGCIKRYARKWK